MKKGTSILFVLIIGLLFSCSNNKSSNGKSEAAAQAKKVENNSGAHKQSQKVDYETYTNPRFGYSLAYPSFLTPQPESINGDGRTFSNGNNEEITVYASYNVLESSIQDIKQMYESSFEGSIDYSTQKSNWFVLSGVNSKGNVFYMKTILDNDVEYTVQITYPKNKKDSYDEIVDKVINNFNVGLPVSYQD